MKKPSLSLPPVVLSVQLRAVKCFKAVLRQPYLPHKAFIGKYLLADIVVLQAEFSVPSWSEQHLEYLMYHLDNSQRLINSSVFTGLFHSSLKDSHFPPTVEWQMKIILSCRDCAAK